MVRGRLPDDGTTTAAQAVNYDVVVVGAGPAGCAAAYDLSAAGLSVLLVDQRDFPRVKACAGGITVKALRALRYSIAPVILEVCTTLVVGRSYESSRSLEGSDPICAMTIRSELDMYCLQQTIARGAHFRVAKKIGLVAEDELGVTITLDDEVQRAKFMIGADGVNSRVRHLLGGEAPVRGFALEACAARDPGTLPPMEFQFGVVDFGYGWLFPKGDHVNVGLYTNDPKVRISRAAVTEFARRKLGTEKLEGFVGHHLGLEGWRTRQPWNRIFLVGDAAGLVDPLMGEGIFNAIVSGQAAARAVVDSKAAVPAARRLFQSYMAPVLRDLHSGYRSAVPFYRHLTWGLRFLAFAPTKLALMRGYALGMTFSESKQWFFLAPFRKVPSVGSIMEWKRSRPSASGAVK
jgi:geranylgeranyl reductase family protein